MSEKIKVLFVGAGGPRSAATVFESTFRALGHQTSFVVVEEFYSPGLLNRVLNRALRPIAPTPDYWGVGDLETEILTQALSFRPDLVLFFDPQFVRPGALQTLREYVGAPLFCWTGQDPFPPGQASRFYYDSLALYDCHFTPRSDLVAEFLRAKAQKAIHLPKAVPTHRLFPLKPSAEELKYYEAEVGFAGGYSDDKRAEYLERLTASGIKVKIFGEGWEAISSRSHLCRARAILPRTLENEELSKAINSFQICVAFFSDQLFEVPACGGFLMCERTDEATELFREGVEAEFFGSYEELREKTYFYLQNRNSRGIIARKGYERVCRPDVSFSSRAQEILAQYRKLAPVVASAAGQTPVESRGRS